MDDAINRFTGDCPIAYSTIESKLAGEDRWITTAPLRYYVGKYGSNTYVDVPEGFVTDGATVPRILWSIVPPWGSYGNAVIIHDYLCESKSLVRDGRLVTISNIEIDTIFKEALEVGPTKPWQMHLILFGINTYRKLGLRS